MQRTPILVRERGSSFNKVLDFVDEKQASSENGKLASSFIELFFSWYRLNF